MRSPLSGPSDYGLKTDEPMSDIPTWVYFAITLVILGIGVAVAIINSDISGDYAPCDTSTTVFPPDSTPLGIFMALLYSGMAGLTYGFLKGKQKLALISACLLAIAMILATLPPAYACI